MSQQSERLRTVVQETANASIAVSVNDEGFFTLLGNTKQRFVNPDLDVLCEEISDFIIKNRKEKTPTNRSPKLYTL